MQVRNKIQLFFLMLFSFYVTTHGKTVVYFSPDDRPRNHLINYIQNAQDRIYAAIYMFTDKKIAQALIDAKKRKVDVQVICDKSSVEGKYGKIKMLVKNNIPTFKYKPNSKRTTRYYAPLMHNKYAIIDNMVWTGSFNWTVSANTRNQENVICSNSKKVCYKYLSHFEQLKQSCKKLKKKKVQQAPDPQESEAGILSSIYNFFNNLFAFE